MSCPICAQGLPPDVPRCPDCGSPNPLADPSGSTRSDWNEPRDVTETHSSGPFEPPSGLLGFIVLYAPSAESASGPDTTLGRVFPLRKGDVFFVGKAPAPTEIPLPDGRRLVPTAWHLFPFTEEFAHISRRHLAIEMTDARAASLIDLSTNGLYLVNEGRHSRRGRGEAVRTIPLSGRQRVVLGVDLGSSGDGALREKASRYELQIVPVAAATTGDDPTGRGRTAR